MVWISETSKDRKPSLQPLKVEFLKVELGELLSSCALRFPNSNLALVCIIPAVRPRALTTTQIATPK
jgi:hypothetical protein